MTSTETAGEHRTGARSILVIHNPAAGRRGGARFEEAVRSMEAAGAVVTIHRTARAGEAESVARECAGVLDVVVASGGDGTVNEVINGLGRRPDGLPVPSLGILPLGTANVLARELDYPRGAREIGRLLAVGPLRSIHLGDCNGRRFALMAGAGFDGLVVDRVDLGLKKRFGRLAYAVQAARELVTYDPSPYMVAVDGAAPVAAWSVVVAKGRRYGGSFHLARDADVREPDLHVCLFGAPGRLGVLAYLAGTAFGAVHRIPGFRIVRGKRVTVTGRASDPVQVDGDRGWSLPLDVRSCDRPLGVVAP